MLICLVRPGLLAVKQRPKQEQTWGLPMEHGTDADLGEDGLLGGLDEALGEDEGSTPSKDGDEVFDPFFQRSADAGFFWY